MAEAVAEPAAANHPAFLMHYGMLAVLVGWFVTFLTFCAVFASFMGVSAMIYGFLPALLIGLPLGALTGWSLRRIRNQWWHVLIHAAVTGVVTMAIGLMLGGLQGAQGALLFAAMAAFSAAAGRASVIRNAV